MRGRQGLELKNALGLALNFSSVVLHNEDILGFEKKWGLAQLQSALVEGGPQQANETVFQEICALLPVSISTYGPEHLTGILERFLYTLNGAQFEAFALRIEPLLPGTQPEISQVELRESPEIPVTNLVFTPERARMDLGKFLHLEIEYVILPLKKKFAQLAPPKDYQESGFRQLSLHYD